MVLNDLPVGRKLFLGFGMVFVLLGAVSLLSFSSFTTLFEDINALQRLEKSVAELKDREQDHMEWAMDVSMAMVSPNTARERTELDPAKCAFGLWYYGPERKRLEAAAPEARDAFRDMEAIHTRFHEAVKRALAAQSERQEAGAEESRRIYAGEIMPALKLFRENIRAINAVLGAKVVEQENAALEQVARGKAKMLFFALAAVAVGAFMALGISRGLTGPLRQLVLAADRIAAGELNVAGLEAGRTSERKDEVGALFQSFRHMVESLSSVARAMGRVADGDLSEGFKPRSEADAMGSALAAMVANLKELTGRIRLTVEVLAASTNQISSTTAELSSSSAQTAASVSETTATVEEVRQTADFSSQKAKAVAESARESFQVAQVGRKSTEDIEQGMRRIREKMDFIAQNIIKLSEKGQMIGEIIAAVNDLADQSNILAVNASIEAAKAGEEGRGFAVVAQEIRNLAEQSKLSTAEISAILDDIRKATAAAVMVTEEGGKAVAEGEIQTEKAARSILTLVESATKDASAAAQIAASSQEELLGMEQVAQAMANIRLATEQNLEAARQLEASTGDLNEMTRKLSGLVGRYRL